MYLSGKPPVSMLQLIAICHLIIEHKLNPYVCLWLIQAIIKKFMIATDKPFT